MVGLVVSVLLVVHQQMINDLSNQKCEIQHHTKNRLVFEDSSTTKKTISTIVIAGKIVLLTSLDILVELS